MIPKHFENHCIITQQNLEESINAKPKDFLSKATSKALKWSAEFFNYKDISKYQDFYGIFSFFGYKSTVVRSIFKDFINSLSIDEEKYINSTFINKAHHTALNIFLNRFLLENEKDFLQFLERNHQKYMEKDDYRIIVSQIKILCGKVNENLNNQIFISASMSIDNNVNLMNNMTSDDENNERFTNDANGNLYDEANVNLNDKANVNLNDKANVNLNDKANVNLNDEANVNLNDEANVNLNDEANVNLNDEANIILNDDNFDEIYNDGKYYEYTYYDYNYFDL